MGLKPEVYRGFCIFSLCLKQTLNGDRKSSTAETLTERLATKTPGESQVLRPERSLVSH